MSQPSQPIDLRSDTVTRPTPAMLDAMHRAKVGDDVLGDDPTIIELEARIASLLGKEAAAFVPSGTMANQTAIRAQTEPGDEIIAHGESHIIHYETGGPAALAGCMVRPLTGARGMFTPDDVRAALRPSDHHYPRPAMLVCENTHNRGGGSVWPLERIAAVTGVAAEHGLIRHLDGARLWNACIARGVEPSQYAAHFDTVSVCFSKGLGCPVGSAVAGPAKTIHRVKRFRKMFGGTMRQSGILAAAALYAIEHHFDRMIEDHANARRLADGVAAIEGISVDPTTIETNMVFFDLAPSLPDAAAFCAQLKAAGVWVLPTAPRRVRAVTHLDVTRTQIDRAIAVIAETAASASRAVTSPA